MGDDRGIVTESIIVNVPHDIAFEILVLLGRYSDFDELSRTLVPKLQTPERLKQARKRLIKYRPRHRIERYPEVSVLANEQWLLDKKLHNEDDKPAFIEYEKARPGVVVAQYWYRHGKLHRDGDLPAYIRGTDCTWFTDGEIHRDGDLPAHVSLSGKQWYRNGDRHRDGDLPAIVYDNGHCEWYKNGLLHRDGDQPALVDINTPKEEWYKNGKLHRSGDKPAVVNGNGSMWWYQNGKLYRDGLLPDEIRVMPDNVTLYFKQGHQIRSKRGGYIPMLSNSMGHHLE